MNDSDIIKALKCQLGIDTSNNCFGCLYRENKSCINASECILEVVEDLINRQKAEIEKLKRDVDEAWCEYSGLQIDKDEMFNEAVALIKNAGIKAIKEFAERLNKQAFCVQQTEWEGRVVDCEDIDSLVKEMTEEK